MRFDQTKDTMSMNQWQQVKCGYLDKNVAQVDDDGQSTAVPSDVLDGTVSDLSTWDTGNLEDLGSFGALTSKELRTARLDKINRVSNVSKGKTASGAGLAAKAKSAPSVAPGKSSAELRAEQLAKLQLAGSKAASAIDDRSTAATSEASVDLGDVRDSGALSAAQLRAARLQSSAQTPSKAQQPIKPQPVASQVVRPKASPKAKSASPAESIAREHAGSQLNAELNKSSREAIRDMGLWEYMPARNPVVTRHTAKGADWNIGFNEYEHSLGGVPDSKPVERPHKADEAFRQLDMESHEAIKEMGLRLHMPAKNPVVTHQTKKGAAWHIGFEDYEHSLGGVPDSQPVERPHKADELTRRLDIQSRDAIKEMGLWEHMPARNPVVTQQTKKGAAWHVGFGEYVHTLGGVPDPQPVPRPHQADVMNRHLDKSSRETIKNMGPSAYGGNMFRPTTSV